MLSDVQFKKVYVACGYTDLRQGIDGLAMLIKFKYKLEPKDRDTLFLFCGRRSDRIKGLVWEGDGWLLLYKRVEEGRFSWPRTENEAVNLSHEQYKSLMEGFEIVPKHPIKDVGDQAMVI